MKYKWWLIISGLILLVMVWWHLANSKVKVIFCDVGQGDGMLLQKGSFQMLVDVGGKNQGMLGCLSRHMPFWDKSIEAVVISHWDEDHAGGLDGLEKFYRIENLYANSMPNKVTEQKVYPILVAENDILRYGSIDFEILNQKNDSGDTNEKSIVGVIRYKDNKILMMGDSPVEVEQGLVWRKKLDVLADGVDVLKVSHHGSALATSEELLDKVRPKEAVISVGKNNKFGHPTKIVLERLERRGIKIKRTDNMGDVVVTYQ